MGAARRETVIVAVGGSLGPESLIAAALRHSIARSKRSAQIRLRNAISKRRRRLANNFICAEIDAPQQEHHLNRNEFLRNSVSMQISLLLRSRNTQASLRNFSLDSAIVL